MRFLTSFGITPLTSGLLDLVIKIHFTTLAAIRADVDFFSSFY